MGKFFKLSEMTKSDTAKSRNIDNSPTEFEEVKNLSLLVDNLLDPLRELYGGPIMVTSGFRNEKVNSLVGGAKNSHHRTGQAADLKCSDNLKLFNLILNSGLKWTQLINEKPNSKGVPSWIHVSYVENNLKNQVLNIK